MSRLYTVVTIHYAAFSYAVHPLCGKSKKDSTVHSTLRSVHNAVGFQEAWRAVVTRCTQHAKTSCGARSSTTSRCSLRHDGNPQCTRHYIYRGRCTQAAKPPIQTTGIVRFASSTHRDISALPRVRLPDSDPRHKRRPLSLEQKGKVMDMVTAGRRIVDVAAHFKVNKSTIRTIRQIPSFILSSLLLVNSIYFSSYLRLEYFQKGSVKAPLNSELITILTTL